MGSTKAPDAAVEAETFMTLLRKHRMAIGLTQTALAKKLGLKAPSTVSLWESGDSIPSPKLIPHLARILGVKPLRLTEIIENSDASGR
jgi:transcriptional regulator with XRE-family HTH domain